MQTRYGFNMETKSDSKVQCLYVFFLFLSSCKSDNLQQCLYVSLYFLQTDSNTVKLRNGTIFTKTELSTIGTTLVSIFRHQAKTPTHPLEQKHFAVVYLTSSKEELLNLHQDGSIVTDNSYSLLPPDDQLTRYITARPDDRKCHAEDLIMKKFYKLVQVFDSEVKYIVLFTWLFPCRDCI